MNVLNAAKTLSCIKIRLINMSGATGYVLSPFLANDFARSHFFD